MSNVDDQFIFDILEVLKEAKEEGVGLVGEDILDRLGLLMTVKQMAAMVKAVEKSIDNGFIEIIEHRFWITAAGIEYLQNR